MLEMRVKTLETWAGPGQSEALAEGQRAIRADLAGLRADFKAEIAEVRSEMAGLRADFKAEIAEVRSEMAGLRADMGEVKDTLQEVLRRLPPVRD